jgi:hypothetical protein
MFRMTTYHENRPAMDDKIATRPVASVLSDVAGRVRPFRDGEPRLSG